MTHSTSERMPPRYIKLKDGVSTTPDDPERFIWYSANKDCGFWTDNVERLSRTQHSFIPCCPTCGMVGYQTTAGEWDSGAEAYDKDHPGYIEKLNAQKDTCGRASACTQD